jgi:hypothetical protein
MRFEILVREMRLLRDKPCTKKGRNAVCIQTTHRSALQMIQFLGELIAAQHYIEQPFMPHVLIGHANVLGEAESVEVPLFVVKRDHAGLKRAAVIVRHEREIFYIPHPEFGSRDEAGSLQALDLVLQSVRAATTKQDIPKISPTVNVAKQ